MELTFDSRVIDKVAVIRCKGRLLFGVPRAAGGGLKLCQMSPKVLKVLDITHVGSLFPAYTSEAEAIDAFSIAPRTQGEPMESLKTRIVCVDPSKVLPGRPERVVDPLLLTRPRYEVYTTRYMGEASTLTRATRPKVLICGPGMAAVPTAAAAIGQLRQDGDLAILQLASDFRTTEAGQAGQDLVSRVQALVAE